MHPRPTPHQVSGKDVADRIQRLCEIRGVIWRDVARKAGVSRTWLIELPNTHNPSLLCILEVAAVLEVHPRELLWPEAAQATAPL